MGTLTDLYASPSRRSGDRCQDSDRATPYRGALVISSARSPPYSAESPRSSRRVSCGSPWLGILRLCTLAIMSKLPTWMGCKCQPDARLCQARKATFLIRLTPHHPITAHKAHQRAHPFRIRSECSYTCLEPLLHGAERPSQSSRDLRHVHAC